MTASCSSDSGTGCLTRRSLLSGAAALGVAGLMPGHSHGTPTDGLGLKDRAARRGLVFGAAVNAHDLRRSAALRAALQRDCAIITPENEMKWGYVEKRRGYPDYRDAQAIANFAAKQGLKLRGHAAMWYSNIPNWVKEAISGEQGHDIMLRRVEAVVSHFRGRVVEWDVVNEAIEPRDGLADGMRRWPEFAKGDPAYIVDCFHAARAADPDAVLVYNDWGFEYNWPVFEQRRKSVLILLEKLVSAGAPIDQFGIQCHCKIGNDFDERVYADFLAEAAALGLKLSLTELDISDIPETGPIETRDQRVADHARMILSVAFDQPAVVKLMTWGLSDMTSWLNAQMPRPDGTLQRALPLDEAMKRKPLWYAIAECLDAAPERPDASPHP